MECWECGESLDNSTMQYEIHPTENIQLENGQIKSAFKHHFCKNCLAYLKMQAA